MTTYDIIFWLLIVLIAVLAFTIESGLSARHRGLVLTSILSATFAAIYMMFIVEDNSEFGTGENIARKKEKEKVVLRNNGSGGSGNLMDNIEIAEGGEDGLGDEELDELISRYEDAALLRKPGGFKDCPECPLMTMIPAGQFIIGSPADEVDRNVNEGPQKVIRLNRPRTISRYEIQYKEFAAFVLATRYSVTANCKVVGTADSTNWKSTVRGDKTTVNHPVVCLNWKDVESYAKWLTEKTKRTYRLPSEAEWEYAARAGGNTRFWTGDDIKPEEANFAGIRKGTSKVSEFSANSFKLFDVAGNAWEMVEDCWTANLKNVPASGVSDRVVGDCTQAAVRGGGWDSPKSQVRSASRRPMGRDQAFNNVGFRLVRDIK